MKVKNEYYRTIWVKQGVEKTIQIIDQRYLPHKFIIEDLNTLSQVVTAIKDMHVRGAGLIGATAGFGMYLAALSSESSTSFDEDLKQAAAQLTATRPTAVNLTWAVERQLQAIQKGKNNHEKVSISLRTAKEIADEDAENCKKIGKYGLDLIEEIQCSKKGNTVNIVRKTYIFQYFIIKRE